MAVTVSSNDRATTVNVVVWTLQALSGCFVALRMYCKIMRSRGVWIDDFFLLAAWFLLLASAIFTTINAELGFGHHVGEIPLENLSLLGIFSNVSGTTSILATAASKTSFALTLLRISDDRWTRVVIWIIIVSLNITMNLSGLFFWVQCNPPEKSWNPLIEGECWPTRVTVVYGIVIGAYSSFCDFLLALLPWKILMTFRMYRKEKIGVALAMSAGALAGVTGIIKCTTLPLLESGDFTFDGQPLVIWGFVECTSVIIGASIPMLRPLLTSRRLRRVRELPSLTRRWAKSKSLTTRSRHDGPKTSERSTRPRPNTGASARRDDRSDRSILGAPIPLEDPTEPLPVLYSRPRDDSVGNMGYELDDIRQNVRS